MSSEQTEIKVLDDTGLGIVWAKIKTLVLGKELHFSDPNTDGHIVITKGGS